MNCFIQLFLILFSSIIYYSSKSPLSISHSLSSYNLSSMYVSKWGVYLPIDAAGRRCLPASDLLKPCAHWFLCFSFLNQLNNSHQLHQLIVLFAIELIQIDILFTCELCCGGVCVFVFFFFIVEQLYSRTVTICYCTARQSHLHHRETEDENIKNITTSTLLHIIMLLFLLGVFHLHHGIIVLYIFTFTKTIDDWL